MSEATTREWKFYIADMIQFCNKVLSYTQDLSQIQFEESSLIFDATLRNLELIGESATHVPTDIRNTNPQIPWRMIIATRNQLIHGYLGIDNDTVWSIIKDDIPELLKSLNTIVE